MNIDAYLWEIYCYPFDCDICAEMPKTVTRCIMCGIAYNMILRGEY